MKWQTGKQAILAAVAGLALLIAGCGGGSTGNVVTVTVTPVAVTAIAGQVVNFTATVGGSTTLTVTWACTYVYTPLPTTAVPNPTPTKAAACNSGDKVNGGSIGTWVITNTNGSNVLTYTAPSLSNFPNPIPVITFTATADANKKKTGAGVVGLDSGIRVSIAPTTATVPVGISPAQTATFNVSFLNSPPVNAQFKLVQPNSADTKNVNNQTANPLSDTCTVSSPTTSSPGCGSIDSNGVYTAPIALPTDTVPAGSKSTAATTVFVVAWSSADTTHFAVATITLVNASTNAVSYSGLYPTTIAAGGILQDVFLNASNLLNTTQIFFIAPVSAANLGSGTLTQLDRTTQIFTIPISPAYCTPSAPKVTPVVTCDASIMTRVRLLADQLKQPEPDPTQPAWIMVANLPGTKPTQPPTGCQFFPNGTYSVACPIDIVNAGPGLVAAVPNSIPQVSGFSTLQLGVNGGYYGISGSLATLKFNGQNALLDTANSGPRQLVGTTQSFQLPNPGLYEVTVNNNSTQGTPPAFKTLITNTAVQPNFSSFTPNPTNSPSTTCIDPSNNLPLSGSYPRCVLLNGGGNPAPSAIGLNSTKGYAVITEQATSALQLVDLATGVPLQVGAPTPIAAVSTTPPAPTDIAIDSQLSVNGGDLAAIIGSGDSTLYLYSVNPQATPPFALVKTVSLDLRTLLNQPSGTGFATPFAIGIDPGTHLAVVAYSKTGIGANVGFVVDVNPNLDASDQRKCFLSGQSAPCVVAPVSVLTGTTPKVVMQPNVPLGYVTPGGGTGATSVVDLLQQGKSAQIAPFVSGGTSGAVRTAGVTKIITSTPHGINPVLGGTVIISGITTSTANSNFNGTFQVLPGSVTDPYTFSYSQADQTVANDVENNTSSSPGTVQYGVPYYSFGTSTTVSGGAINPITRTFAYVDYNQTSGQVGFISTLDQTATSLTLTAGSCNGCTPTPSGVPEIGFRSVSFDPFTNVLVAYAPTENTDPSQDGNKISLINPGGPQPGGSVSAPYRIIAATPTGQVGRGSYTPSGATAAVSVYGPMVYDPKTKNVLVANAGSNSLTFMSIDPAGSFQKAQIQDVKLFDSSPAYGVPVVQPPLSTSNPSHAPGTCSLTDPTQPCMPRGVQVGKAATLRVLGQGFSTIASPLVRLDGQSAITPPGQNTAVSLTTTVVSDSELHVSIPAAVLFAPHDYALDVQAQAGGDATNSIQLHVVGLLDMASGGKNGCTPTTSFPQGPEGVAIDQTRHVALVTNYACNSVSVISIDPTGTLAPFGTIVGSVAVGNQPVGIGVIPRFGTSATPGFAVVANSGDTPNGTASIIDYSTPSNPQIVTWNVTSGTTTTPTNKVTVGLSPLGVGIDQDRVLALVGNQGSDTISSIDLTPLLPDNPSTGGGHVHGAPAVTTVALSGPPTAIAVDPNRAIAVVTNLQNSGTTSVTGGLDVVKLSTTPPIKSSTSSVSSLSASLTGIVYDPAPSTALFYATSTQQNAIYSFNPDTGSVQTVRVGINPYSLGYNYQTGTLLTINSTSNSSSVVDSQEFKTRQTVGISSLSQFAIDVDNFTNIAVIADQNNNRVVFLAMPR